MRRARRQEKAAAQEEGPWTGAVQNESQLQEDTSKLAVGSAEGQAKSRFGGSFLCRTKAIAAGGHEQVGSWQCRRAGKVKVWS